MIEDIQNWKRQEKFDQIAQRFGVNFTSAHVWSYHMGVMVSIIAGPGTIAHICLFIITHNRDFFNNWNIFMWERYAAEKLNNLRI